MKKKKNITFREKLFLIILEILNNIHHDHFLNLMLSTAFDTDGIFLENLVNHAIVFSWYSLDLG